MDFVPFDTWYAILQLCMVQLIMRLISYQEDDLCV